MKKQTKILPFFLFFGLIFLSFWASGKSVQLEDFQSVLVTHCYDGDTCFMDIQGERGIFGKRLGIRFKGIDTAEMRGNKNRPSCLLKAKEAKKETEKLLLNAKKVMLKNCQRGKYFRLVCDVFADGVNVGHDLLKKRLAVAYDGHEKKQKDWCLGSKKTSK